MFLYILISLIPAYVANAIPVLLGGGKPLDFGITLPDGKRFLGKNKTIRGFLAGVSAGTLIGEFMYIFSVLGKNSGLGGDLSVTHLFRLFLSPVNYVLLGFLMGLGAMIGDSFGSFIKRRLGYKSGDEVAILDQITFVLFALLFSLPILLNPYSPIKLTLRYVIYLLVITWVLHKTFNLLANKIGWKTVPW